MKAACFLSLMIISLLCVIANVNAGKVYTIGSLNTADQFVNSFEGFKGRMAELGYREGVNVRYRYYNAKGDDELLKTVANKFVQDKVDMIVTSSTTATVIAVNATLKTQIPVVFLSAGNTQKIINKFSSSESNLTGISSASLELTGKRFELLKELAPQTKKIAMPLNPKGVNYHSIIAKARGSAAKLGFAVSEIPIYTIEELSKTALLITRKDYDAIFHPADSLMSEGIQVLINQSLKETLPLITSLLANVKRGCLGTYASDYNAMGKQGAVLADKILKGANPADLPIELPNKFNLVLNLKTAKSIGLRIPKEILLRADQVFE